MMIMHVPTSDFIDTVFSHSLLPCITRPTRVTRRTSTLIDNILTLSDGKLNTFQGILTTDISDHYPIFLIELNLDQHMLAYRPHPTPVLSRQRE